MQIGTKTYNLWAFVALLSAGVSVVVAVVVGVWTLPAIGALLQPSPAEQRTGDIERMQPVTTADHIRGDPDAPIMIVEYADFECPFCKSFQDTMKQISTEYGNQVAWVYRHFPLDQIHSKARTEAIASECAAALGGTEAFWEFSDRFFERTPSNDRTPIDTVLPQIAEEIGLDRTQFAACLVSGTYDAHVEENVQDAGATGGTGTPWSIVVSKSGKKYPLAGAQPYPVVKQLIERAMSDN